MKKEQLTINQVINAFSNIPYGKEFTRSEILKLVTDLYGNMEVIPSDYCYNRVNNGIDIEKNLREHKCLFEYISKNRYKYLGVGKTYNGLLYHQPTGMPECIVGQITNGILTEDYRTSPIHIREERLTPEEYIGFLKRTDLGSQYPKERFAERIEKLVKNVSVSLAARTEEGLLVGVLFGLTDFAYWLYVTDLGVDRNYTGQGIGRRLMKTAHELAGGERDIAVYLIANENAVPFYEKIGMKKADDVMQYNKIDWTEFTVE